MPRIVNQCFEPLFSTQRDALIQIVRLHLRRDDPQLVEVREWLDTEFSEAAVRERLDQRAREHRARDAGQVSTGHRPGRKHRPRGLPGDGLRADRLETAFASLYAANRSHGLTRLLGPNIPSAERKTNAYRAIVVCSCLVHADADEWLSEVTSLASTPWASDHDVEPWIKGRTDALAVWGHEPLKMLGEACSVLGWKDEDTKLSEENLESAIRAAIERYPTLLDSLVYLAGLKDLQPVIGANATGPAFTLGAPGAFALQWVHSQCKWDSPRNGVELSEYVHQMSRDQIIDAQLRDMVAPKLQALDTDAVRRSLWRNVFERFPHLATRMAQTTPQHRHSQEGDTLRDVPILGVTRVVSDAPVVSLSDAFDQFQRTLKAATVPHPDGLSIPDHPGAILLSQATEVLHNALERAYQDLTEANGKRVDAAKLPFRFYVSDTPEGPGVAVPMEDLEARVVTIGDGGAHPAFMAALERATRATACPVERHNAQCAESPGATHPRFIVNDVMPQATLDTLESVARLLELPADYTGPKEPGQETQPTAADREVSHSLDFTSVVWYGTRYSFNKGNQANAIRYLWEAWEAGGHSLGNETIGDRVGSTATRFRLDTAFRKHPAWGVMIRSAGKGVYRLAPPDDKEEVAMTTE